MTPAERVLNNCIRINDCWIWTGHKRYDGYGQIRVVIAKGKSTAKRVHRVVYEAKKGVIPDGYQLDHLCRNRTCVNPEHLEAVTPRENNLRSTSPAAINAKKTHCIRGHPLSGSNIYSPPKRPTNRHCVACSRESFNKLKQGS